MEMSDVTVIGLGEMGSALAATFLRAQQRVTVWNRTPARAALLVGQGGVLAPDAAAAMGASPVVVVCVSDYAATRAIVEQESVATALRGKLLVQLSTGTPKEARELGAWAAGRGVEYLDGAILAWPSQIGGSDTVILVSGPEATRRGAEPLLKCLAGALTPMGEELGSSSALFAAVLAYLAGRWIGLCHGALVCEAEGLSVASFGALLADLAPILGQDARHMGEVIAANDFADPESTLKTAGADIRRLVQHGEEAGINAELPRFAAGLFARAIAAGHGAEEHAALIKILRAP